MINSSELNYFGKINKRLNIVLLFALSLAFIFFLLCYIPVIQDLLIKIGEKLLSRELNHSIWKSRIKDWSKFYCPIVISLLILKCFSIIFVNRCKNSFLNLLRCLAMATVFFLHTSIFVNSRGSPLFEKEYMKVFQTSAWGGVWIFFILSGFLAGKSFVNGRYDFEMKSICRYYWNRIQKIIIPTYAFIFLCCVLVHPTYLKNNPIALLEFLTFSYNGNPGADGIGATWYVFTLVPLYLLTPLFCFIAIKANEKKLLPVILTFVLLLNFIYRFFAIINEIDWYNMVYTPFFGNIDLFFGGICLSLVVRHIPKILNSANFKDISLFTLLCFIILNAIFYEQYFFHWVFCPSLYFILTGFCLICYSDEKWINKYDTRIEKCLSFFSSISFEFYLFHSLVLYSILPAFKEQHVVFLYFKLLGIGFILSSILGFGFKLVFKNGRKI